MHLCNTDLCLFGYLLFILMFFGQIRVCLRYDRSEEQRNHFIHEAELSAPLNHENILHLYGVVLPGLYVDSVALVSYCTFDSSWCL